MGQPKRKERKDEESGAAEPTLRNVEQPADGADWKAPVSRVTIGLVVGAIVLFNLPMLHYYLLRPRPAAPLSVPYSTDFSDPNTVRNDFFSTGGLWRVENGQLLSPGVKNNPLWLKAKLPQNVAVEFDTRSVSPEGDIKVEIFGDGSDHASGYVLIHGGWNNSLSIIARLDEHGKAWGSVLSEAGQVQREKGLADADPVKTGVFRENTRTRVEAAPFPVQIGRTYHWRIERRGSLIVWSIDGREFMRFDDPIPLVGEAHNRFGFSSWEAQLYFDNLKIEPLN